jgi:uncharacterized protein (TIGR04255 family)
MVTARPADLPDFNDPPVVEMLLSVQFDRLSSLKAAHFGLYWNEIRDRFPVTQEQIELPLIMERPEQEHPQVPLGIQFQTLEAPLTPRFWFQDQRGSELIQVQRDRFIKNWRKMGNNDPYPHYEKLRKGFDQDLIQFTEFLNRNDLGSVRVNQCEVTYINHIVAGDGWENHSEIDKVFTMWRQPKTAFPGPASEVTFRASFAIPDDDAGSFAGRLHVTVQPVTRLTDGKPMFVMELTARGQVGDGMEFFNLGRKWIVKSFAELTTPLMHGIWKRKD